MTVVTDDLSVARDALVATDDVIVEDLQLRNAPIQATSDAVTVEVAGVTLGLSSLALKQLSSELGIPANYLVKCPATLQAQNMAHWQGELSSRKRIATVIGQDHIQAITSPNFEPVANAPIFDALVELVGHGDNSKLSLDTFEHSWESTRISLTYGDLVHRVENAYYQTGAEVGDLVRGGVAFTNSMTAAVETEIEPFVLRIACLNGMLSPVFGGDRAQFRYRRKDGPPDVWLRDAVDAIGEQYESLFVALDTAAQAVLDDPQRAIRDQIRSIPGPMREEVVNAYQEEPMPTVWGVANAITRAARDGGFEAAHRVTAQRHAGWFATSPEVCSTCGRPRSNHRH
jgi:hypothetical protein